MMYTLFAWIENLPPVIAFTESLFAYPVVQGVHVLALAFAVGLLGLADLRLAGLLLPDHSERAIVSALRPWFIAGFCVLLVTGLLLFLPKATALYNHPLFLVKLGLIALAGLNAFWFELNYRRAEPRRANQPRENAHREDQYRESQSHVSHSKGTAAWHFVPPRVAGLVSLGLWITIIVLGRLLAYF
jgi:hypothetical protein